MKANTGESKMSGKTKLGVLITLLFFVAFMGAFINETPSWSRSIRPGYRQSGLVSVSIIGDNRGILRESYSNCRYCKPSYYGSKYITAIDGERYRIRVTNHNSERVGIVISVDGLNIISGKKSYNRHDESMYILYSGQTCDFSGWRSSMSSEQRFYFTDSYDSYASRMGDVSNLGKIKIAIFREKRHYKPFISLRKNKKPGSVMDEASSFKRSARPGTGYGEGTYSPAQKTEFDSERNPSQLINYEYVWEHHAHYHQPKYRKNEFAVPPPE